MPVEEKPVTTEQKPKTDEYTKMVRRLLGWDEPEDPNDYTKGDYALCR